MVCRKNGEVGNMVFQCYVGKMVIGNVAVENTVVGKKLWYLTQGIQFNGVFLIKAILTKCLILNSFYKSLDQL